MPFFSGVCAPIRCRWWDAGFFLRRLVLTRFDPLVVPVIKSISPLQIDSLPDSGIKWRIHILDIVPSFLNVRREIRRECFEVRQVTKS